MPEAPAHDIATPRRQVGGRCRKWCISAQQTSDKRTCAACCMCGQQFGHGETRLQQWCSRNSHCAHVHAQCVNGGVAHDHELLPKHPTVQDVVETVVRQRECVNRAAAYPLPPTQIKHPLMTIRTCSVVRRLFAWTRKSWTSSGSTQSRRTASKIHVTPRTFNLRHGSSLRYSRRSMPSLRALTHHNPSSLASEPAWKALVLSSWLLLGRSAVNASESNCAHYLEARLDLFWAEDWPALWAMVRAECDGAPVHSTTRRTATEQKQSRIRKEATLARSGERGRALAAVRNVPPVPVTEQSVQEIKSLYPTDPDPAAPAQAFVASLFLSEVAELFPPHCVKCHDSANLDRSACVLSIGVTWRVQAGNSNLFVQVVARIAAAAVPPFCATVPQSWSNHAARQTHWWTQTDPHDVVSPQACFQISHGSQEGSSGQLCWTPTIRSGTTGWCQHHQDKSISCGG